MLSSSCLKAEVGPGVSRGETIVTFLIKPFVRVVEYDPAIRKNQLESEVLHNRVDKK
jgi:hypothetical protein